MKTELESKTVYVSNDGKKRSYSQSEIEAYEKRQLKEIFERRTIVAHISTSTTLYLFKKGDIKTFKEFHPEAYLDAVSEDEEGYFVYVYDSTYDDIGDSYHLYHQRWYKTMTLERIEHYKDILDSITNGVMMRETLHR
jgi:hypothetical protein